MTRALWLLALLSAFFVVAVRCLGGFVASSPADSVHGAQACVSADDDDEQADTLDESDDSGFGRLRALPVSAVARAVTFADTKGKSLGCGAMTTERALASHRASLDRPPRA